MSKIDSIIDSLKIKLPNPTKNNDSFEIGRDYDYVKDIIDVPGKYCGIDQLSQIFSWRKGMSYLFSGTPNTGKSTMVLYLFLLMSVRFGYKWCVWSPEMEDAELRKGVVIYHAKDIIFTLMWTLLGKTPYQHYANKHRVELMTEEEKSSSYAFITDHFKFVHIDNRTPGGIMDSFKKIYDTEKVDGFLIDPWKSVKQIMNARADIWMEDTLMDFKTFSLETDSIMNYIVHPKAMKDYRDANGEFRVITPHDLNGGAAWYNSMDAIVTLRRLKDHSEWYTYKLRKQHLLGITGSYHEITFDMDQYRFYFGSDDPFKGNGITDDSFNIDYSTGEVEQKF